MTTINISLPDQMKEFVDEEMGEGDHRDPSDYFNALLQEQLKRKGEQKLEGLLREGLISESSAVDKRDREFIRGELFCHHGFTQKVGSTESAFSGRLKIAQRFIAGIGPHRAEVREADG